MFTKIFLILLCCTISLADCLASRVCEPVQYLQTLMDECGESSYKKLLMNRFVRTGNYGDPVPVYSPGIDYNRQANDAEKEIMFRAILESALGNNAVTTACLFPLRSVKNNKSSYANYDQVYKHHLTIYAVAKLAELAWYNSLDRNRHIQELRLLAQINNLCEDYGEDYGERILADDTFKKALKKCQESIRKKEASAREPYKKTWEDEVVEAIYTATPKTISREDLKGANPISVLYSTHGKLLGKYGKLVGKYGSPSSMRPVYVLSHHLGLGGHLAPTLFFENEGEVIYCEKFIKLFDDEAEEKKYTDRIPSMEATESCRLEFLMGRQNKNGDVSGLCLENRLPGGLDTFLGSVSPDSLDDLFLHQILLDPLDSTARNFLFQYQNGQLCLVRIDYGDGFLEKNKSRAYFFGASSPPALKPFGRKGQQNIGDLDKLLNNPNLWKKSTLDGFTAEKQYKLRQRLRILHMMHQRGFFTEQHSRLETMAALFYVALRTSIQGGGYTYPFVVDSYFITHQTDYQSTEDSLKEREISAISSLLLLPWRDLDDKSPITTTPSADLDATLIDQAIHDWMTLPVKQRPLIKEEYAKVDKIFTSDGALRIKTALG